MSKEKKRDRRSHEPVARLLFPRHAGRHLGVEGVLEAAEVNAALQIGRNSSMSGNEVSKE